MTRVSKISIGRDIPRSGRANSHAGMTRLPLAEGDLHRQRSTANGQRIQSRAMIRARVITCSDAASRGQREDRSGPAVREILAGAGFEVDAVRVVADDVDAIAGAIENATA